MLARAPSVELASLVAGHAMRGRRVAELTETSVEAVDEELSSDRGRWPVQRETLEVDHEGCCQLSAFPSCW